MRKLSFIVQRGDEQFYKKRNSSYHISIRVFAFVFCIIIIYFERLSIKSLLFQILHTQMASNIHTDSSSTDSMHNCPMRKSKRCAQCELGNVDFAKTSLFDLCELLMAKLKASIELYDGKQYFKTKGKIRSVFLM